VMRPTLILGDEPRVVLPVARSLWRQGIPVMLARTHEDSRPVYSRALRRSFLLPGAGRNDLEMLGCLSEIISKEQVDFLIPSSDSALRFVADHYDALRVLTNLACPDPSAIRLVLDKGRTMQAAAECGIRTPRTMHFASVAELLAAGDSLRFPLIAKPASKKGAAAFKIRYYRDVLGLAEDYRTQRDFAKDYLLQEYVPGEGWGVEVLMVHGKAELLFAHRRLKEHPSTGGVSALAASESLIPQLVESSVRLLNHIGWSGVAMVEFRYDPSSGAATLMEVNGRFWGSIALSSVCGIDFPYAAWQVAHGIPVKPVSTYARGVKARWTAGLLMRLRELTIKKDDGVPRPSLWRESLAFVGSFGPRTHDMLWSWRDPRPALAELASVTRRMIVEDGKRIIRNCAPEGWLRHVRLYRLLGAGPGRVYLRRQFARRLASPPNGLAGVRRVLFVCHGNIIRSPMAAALFGRCSETSAGSAGIEAKVGRGADERAVRVAAEFGIDLKSHVTAPISEVALELADLVLVMDVLNEARLLHRFPLAKGRLRLLGEFAPRPLEFCEIRDPYTGDEDTIRQCYRIIDECVRALAERLKP
jgi:predicted ATP-grasp superfamily ATP-dependent carboligase/protein-tyrosine-phosphatase